MNEDEELIFSHIKNTLNKDVKQLIDNTNPRIGSTITIESEMMDKPRYTISITKTDKPHKMSKYTDEERYKITISTNLDHGQKQHITQIKDIFYTVFDKLFPNTTTVVNQDYPSGTVNMKHRTTKDEFKNLLQ